MKTRCRTACGLRGASGWPAGSRFEAPAPARGDRGDRGPGRRAPAGCRRGARARARAARRSAAWPRAGACATAASAARRARQRAAPPSPSRARTIALAGAARDGLRGHQPPAWATNAPRVAASLPCGFAGADLRGGVRTVLNRLGSLGGWKTPSPTALAASTRPRSRPGRSCPQPCPRRCVRRPEPEPPAPAARDGCPVGGRDRLMLWQPAGEPVAPGIGSAIGLTDGEIAADVQARTARRWRQASGPGDVLHLVA